MQLGYEVNFEDGFGSAISGSLINFEDDVYNKLNAIDFFSSAELRLVKKLVLRPGVRFSLQSQFQNLWATSLSAKYLLSHDIEWRTSVGTSFRTPNYDELFTFVDDGNHQIYGNDNLLPEKSLSVFTYFKKESYLNNNIVLSNKIKLGFVDLNDRITLSIVDTTPLVYQYLNIDSHKTFNISSENSIRYKQLKARIGATFLATQSKWFEPDGSLVSEALNDYLYTLQVNSSIVYSYTPWNTQFAINYKFNGPQEEFVLANDTEDNLVLIKGETNSFSWMDASIKKQLFSNRTSITLGARNIFNVTELTTTAVAGPSHGSDSISSIPLGYGRSYYIKIKHNFKF
jgi:outer membrane receptor for ferrienterochelin and colicins